VSAGHFCVGFLRSFLLKYSFFFVCVCGDNFVVLEEALIAVKYLEAAEAVRCS
jgi:hypothetical protein